VTVHPTALAFANVAAAYERGRPSYPRELLEWLVARGDMARDRTVVDLGAGTGKLTRLLAGHGARVLAIEPLAEMRAELESVVPQAEVLAGSAEHLPLPDACADLLTCGQAFHWFATSEALTEIARVVKARGSLVLVWNVRDERDPLQQRLGELLAESSEGTPSFAGGQWRDAIAACGRFDADGELAVETTQLLDRTGLLDRVESTSYVAALAGPERAELLAQVASLVPGDGHVELAYLTRAFAYSRRDGMMAP